VIDVVIPAHAKDFAVLRHAVRSVLRHVTPLGRVYVVSQTRFSWPGERVTWVPEPSSPGFLALEDVHLRWPEQHPETVHRAGWVYQQILKLGAGEYIEDLSPRFLAMDADVVFLRRVSFGEELGRFPYSRATEYHEPYAAAYRQLVGEEPPGGQSFVAHHMLFDRALLAELCETIAQRHATPWQRAYLDSVEFAEPSGIGEWDTYGYWVLTHHPELARHRQLFWRDAQVQPGPLGRAVLGLDYDFVAVHAYGRRPRARRLTATIARLTGELAAALRRS
jgi:Family of unknown function (DUF6492)